MTRLLLILSLLTTTSVAMAVDPFENESIETFQSNTWGDQTTYDGTTVDGDTIRGQHNDYGGGTSTDTWTRTDEDGNSRTTHCESYSGHTFCN